MLSARSLAATVEVCAAAESEQCLCIPSACYADAVSATSMSLINRFCLKVFPLPNTLLLLQMIATVAILYPLLLTGKLKFSIWNYHRFKQLLAISVLYTANTGDSTHSLTAYLCGPRILATLQWLHFTVETARIEQATNVHSQTNNSDGSAEQSIN